MRLLVKVGGAQLEQPDARASFAGALARARAAGHELLVVHGGGNQIRALGGRLGLAERYVDGLRVTEGELADVVLMVLAGLVNRTLVHALQRAGVPAVGVCGADGALFGARKLSGKAGENLGFVGELAQARPELAHALLAQGFTPVIATSAPLAAGEAGSDAHFYNVNADLAAGPLAHALAADALLFLTDVPGVLGAQGELLRELDAERCAQLRAADVLRGGMLPKTGAALAAAAASPRSLIKIAPASGADAVLRALEPTVGTRFMHTGATAARRA